MRGERLCFMRASCNYKLLSNEGKAKTEKQPGSCGFQREPRSDAQQRLGMVKLLNLISSFALG